MRSSITAYPCPPIYFSWSQLFFHKAVQNDTLFLSIINVVDYSILAGFDENSHEVVVGIIDYMRQVRWTEHARFMSYVA